MSKDTRRKFMKSSGAAIGTLALTGVASATDNQSAKDEKLELVDKSVVASKGDNKVVAVSLAKKRENARVTPMDSRAENYIFDVNTDVGSVSFVRVDGKKYNSLTQSPSTMSVDRAIESASLQTAEDIVERFTQWGYGLDTCAAYSSHQHQYAACSAEFNQQMTDYSWTAVAGALTTLVEGALLTGGILLLGGAAAVISDTDTITLGAEEADISKWGWNQTMYGVMVNAGWKRSRTSLVPMSSAPTHPSR